MTGCLKFPRQGQVVANILRYEHPRLPLGGFEDLEIGLSSQIRSLENGNYILAMLITETLSDDRRIHLIDEKLHACAAEDSSSTASIHASISSGYAR
jgi:hypothetical protein